MTLTTRKPKKINEKLLEDTLGYLDNLYTARRTPVAEFEKCVKDVFGFNNDYQPKLIVAYWKQQKGLLVT